MATVYFLMPGRRGTVWTEAADNFPNDRWHDHAVFAMQPEVFSRLEPPRVCNGVIP